MIYLQAIYSNKGRCLQACLCVRLQTMQGRVHFAAFSADEETECSEGWPLIFQVCASI